VTSTEKRAVIEAALKAGAKNAALLACQILALGNGSLQKKLDTHKKKIASTVRKKNETLKKSLS